MNSSLEAFSEDMATSSLGSNYNCKLLQRFEDLLQRALNVLFKNLLISLPESSSSLTEEPHPWNLDAATSTVLKGHEEEIKLLKTTKAASFAKLEDSENLNQKPNLQLPEYVLHCFMNLPELPIEWIEFDRIHWVRAWRLDDPPKAIVRMRYFLGQKAPFKTTNQTQWLDLSLLQNPSLQ